MGLGVQWRREDRTVSDASDGGLLNRRRLLRLGGAGLAAGLAGCAGARTVQRTYRASWASLAPDGRPADVTFRGDDEVTTERTLELSEFTVEATIVSHTAQYGRAAVGGDSAFGDDATVGLVATPVAKEAGQRLNPVATTPLSELLSGDVGARFLRQLAVDPNWTTGPRLLEENGARVLGTDATVKTFAGTTAADEFVVLNVVRVVVDGDAVLVGDAHTRPERDGTEVGDDTRSRLVEQFVELLPLVVRERDPRGGPATPATDDPEALPPGRVPMEEVPRAVRKRVVRLLEDAAGSPVTWEDVPSLGTFAHVVGRPDVEGVAYYELAVDPEGFVVAATGEHDVPLPHFNTDGRTMGVRLEEEADAELGRLVWIDRLRYVAEDPDGNRIAARGNEVPKIEGLEALLEHDEEGPRRVEYGQPADVDAGEDDAIDDDYEPEQLLAENDLEPPEEFSFGRWESHAELLDGYESAYGPLLSNLAEEAAEAWETVDETERRVAADRTHREPLLDEQELGAVGGSGGDAVTVEVHEREDAHDVLAVTPTSAASPGDTVEVSLGEGPEAETLAYNVEAPGHDQPVEDLDGPGTPGGQLDVVGGDAARPQKDWAGGFPIQPKYHQYDFQGCPVGCGPVGWALLFGWGDKQAHGGKFNRTWNPRYGLYLDNGGDWTNGDEEAPDLLTGDNGGPRNVIEELNGYTNVFCIGSGNGATAPWDMDDARQYFSGRTGTRLGTVHSWTGRPINAARVNARRSIRGNNPRKGRTPTVVGKGWLSHYPLAFAYWQIWWQTDKVKVNNGWGTRNRVGNAAVEWIWAKSWFAGEIVPY